jgi:hypothetical protein
LLFFSQPNGLHLDDWWASGSGNLTLGSSLQPLQNYASQIVYFDKLHVIHHDSQGHENGVKAGLCGNMDGSNRSIDVELHEWIKQSVPAHRHIYSGVGLPSTVSDHQYVSFSGPGQVNTSLINSPKAQWESVFGNVDTDPGPDKSIIDVHRAELQDLQARLGAVEQKKLDRHLESLRDVENRLGLSIGDCSVMTQPSVDIYQTNDAHIVPEAMDLQMDIIFQAMACGLSRVATLQFGFHTTDMNVKFPGSEMEANPSSRREYHGASHDQDGSILSQMKKWEMMKLARFLEQLANTPEPDSSCDGSMLDNTIVYVFSEVGNGPAHDYQDCRHLLIGGAGGAWSTGRVLNAGENRHSRNLVGIAHAMGHTGISSSFGGWGSGAMPGLF